MNRWGAPALGLLMLGWAVVVGFLALSRFLTFHNRTFDLALYTRGAWGLARLDGWNPVLDQHFLASHWSWVLAPLGLLGRLYGTAEVLLLAQAGALALTAWPLFRIAGRRAGGGFGLLAAGAFLLYPNLIHVGAYEFHPGNLAMPALGFALDAVDRGSGRQLAWSCAAILFCRADFALANLMLVALSLHRVRSAPSAQLSEADGSRLRRCAVVVGFSSLGYLAIVMALRPLFVSTHDSADLHFGPWGGSPLGIVVTALSEPSKVLAHVTETARLTYGLRILLPLALLPLLRVRWLLVALPFVAINLISVFPTTTRIDSHYLTPAVPAMVVAAIDGLSRLRGAARWVGGSALLLASVVASFAQGGAPWSRDYDAAAYGVDQSAWFSDWVLRAIPAGASVQAPDALLPHLAERTRVHRSPPPERGTEYVVLDASHRMRYFGQETLLRTSEEPLVRTFLAREDYAVVEATPALLVLAKHAGPRARFAERFFWHAPAASLDARLCRCLAVGNVMLAGDRLSLRLRVDAPCPSDLALRIGTTRRPKHVRLLFDGYFSPAHLRAGQWVQSDHRLPPSLAARIAAEGLRIGALRTSGAPPEHGDPVSVAIPLSAP